MAIELVDKIKQKNGLKFKLLDAIDIETTFVDEEGNTRDLEDVLKDIFEKVGNIISGGSGSSSGGKDGEDGVGIESITKTSTEGLVDTYTITLTNEETTTFTVTNGSNGVDGRNGENGSNGVGIEDIVKTSTEGLVDTYTITLSNGTTKTFEVTNGVSGELTEEQVENAVDKYFEKNPVAVFDKSSTIPTKEGSIGEIVFNSNPTQGGYVGWVYTALGWLGFGKIEEKQSDTDYIAFETADGNVLYTADGEVFTLSE